MQAEMPVRKGEMQSRRCEVAKLYDRIFFAIQFESHLNFSG